MYFMKLAKKEPEVNKWIAAIVKIAVFVGVVVAVFFVVKYICKKHGIKSASEAPCSCGDDECDCGCFDEDECSDEDDECCCEDECCCDSIDADEDTDEDITVEISEEEKQD